MNNILYRALVLLLTLLPVSVQAGVDTAVSAYERRDYATAFREFSEAAKKGDAEAQLAATREALHEWDVRVGALQTERDEERRLKEEAQHCISSAVLALLKARQG